MKAIELFAGVGGLAEGAAQAGVAMLWAANHSPLAVRYYTANHPRVKVECQDVQQMNWLDVPRHDLMLAAPACQGHSPARGKERPHHDALRSTAWAVVSCLECHRPPIGLVENVPAFLKWALYPSWLDALQRLGYSAAPHIVDAADHGIPQHRKRVVIVLTRSRAPLQLKLPNRPHVGIREFIEWDAHAWSRIRQPGRSANTLARVRSGRARFGDRFVMPYYGSGSGLTGRSLDRPIGTITTRARWAVVDGDRMRMLSPGECSAAMDFPRHYILPKVRHEAIQLLGNAVPPGMARAVISELRRAA